MTDERFEPTEAKFVRLTMLAHSSNPRSAVDSRLDEFEVWTAGDSPRNVALASAGGKATGSQGRVAADFAGAYKVDVVNDGQFGQRWFVGAPAVLTIELAKEETIDRVSFSHHRGAPNDTLVPGLGPFVTEYEVQVSLDGRDWRKVADSFDRQAFTPALAQERLLRQGLSDDDRSRLKNIAADIARLDAQIKAVPPLSRAWVGDFSEPAAARVFTGGDPMKPGAEVRPASLAVLDRVAKPFELPVDAPESQRRLRLAEWIVADDNPLAPRVLANRVWQHHFGTGIVDTPSDFGFLGGKPTHPELLDWLARRLKVHGWRLKPLHREIVLSQTYRQASARREEATRMDGDSRLLWRNPPRRLDAESMRDTLLAVAGKLERRQGGPGFRLYEAEQDNVSTYFPLDRHGPETYRRAVYHQNVRASIVDLLSDFDLPDNAFSVPRRSSTTTPLQALTLLNHRFTLDMAQALVDRVKKEVSSGDAAAQVDRAFTLAFQRQPTEHERTASLRLIEAHGWHAFARGLLNANELAYVE